MKHVDLTVVVEDILRSKTFYTEDLDLEILHGEKIRSYVRIGLAYIIQIACFRKMMPHSCVK